MASEGETVEAVMKQAEEEGEDVVAASPDVAAGERAEASNDSQISASNPSSNPSTSSPPTTSTTPSSGSRKPRRSRLIRRVSDNLLTTSSEATKGKHGDVEHVFVVSRHVGILLFVGSS